MLIRLRVTTNTLSEMRRFLADADIDMGCTPIAEKMGDRYAVTALSDQQEYDRLANKCPDGIEVHALEEVTVPPAPLGMKLSSNRFQTGRIPSGLGLKE